MSVRASHALHSQLSSLQAVATAHGLHSIILQEPANLTWLLGCRVHVPNTLDAACLDVLVLGLDTDEPIVTAVCNRIEAPRLTDTEFASGTVDQVTAVPWWTDRAAHLPRGEGVGSDRARAGTTAISADLAAARRILNPQQRQRLAEVSAEAARAVGSVARSAAPGMSENELAGAVSAALLGAGLEPVVLMVAADGRDTQHRHPLPTSRRGHESFLLVCCARRYGLIASVTRSVNFTGTGLDRVQRSERHRALLSVEAAFLNATRPGTSLGELITAGTQAYADNGFAAEEWHRHHQGGLTGWMPREFPASPTSEVVLREHMAVAWNPSGEGCKAEDTWLVTADGPQLSGQDAQWPSVEIAGRRRPDLLWL